MEKHFESIPVLLRRDGASALPHGEKKEVAMQGPVSKLGPLLPDLTASSLSHHVP